ncbi:MAG: hypothetical protein IKX36_12220 [Prevotella sp.]|nr:hypothetical protein [Prevotella sp.]
MEKVIHDNWYINPIEFPNADDYVMDIYNISQANTGFIHAWDSNLFFEEASQLLVNAIRLFRMGYFDCAFYSLRQALELSIGTIYLTENPEKKGDWQSLKSGFESNTMPKELKNKDNPFKDITEKMPAFFNKIRSTQKAIHKYVHKQGYASFYQVRRNPFLLKQKNIRKEDLLEDFKSYLKVCIGAVAVYRLSIDALPIVLMDEEMLTRSGDLITAPYSEEFVDKYIGHDNIDAFKTTQIYKDFCASLSINEKQNEAVFNLIHWQYYDRERIDDYNAQLHLCTFTDRIAMCIFTISEKISQVFVDGIHWYTSDVKSDNQKRGITIGSSYYEEQFLTSANNYNQPYHNVYLSRCQINNDYTYFEHNEKLTGNEIECVKLVATKLLDMVNQIENEISESVK